MSGREERICDNIGLVHACARRFMGRGIEYDDLFQSGCMGLVKAADGFDEERGLKFSTYAVPVILGEIRRLFRDGGTVKVSRSLKELSLRASRERDAFTAREGREPSVGELADLLGVEREQAVEALGASMPALSLTRAGEEDDGEEIDLPVTPPGRRSPTGWPCSRCSGSWSPGTGPSSYCGISTATPSRLPPRNSA